MAMKGKGGNGKPAGPTMAVFQRAVDEDMRALEVDGNSLLADQDIAVALCQLFFHNRRQGFFTFEEIFDHGVSEVVHDTGCLFL